MHINIQPYHIRFSVLNIKTSQWLMNREIFNSAEILNIKSKWDKKFLRIM